MQQEYYCINTFEANTTTQPTGMNLIWKGSINFGKMVTEIRTVKLSKVTGSYFYNTLHFNDTNI
jgi:hypothetical protein